MLKFIHLPYLHLVPSGQELHGLRPDECLASCVSHIASKHGDSAFCVVSGDLTHKGDLLGCAEAARILSDLPMPVHLMMRNHDDRGIFREAFPSAPPDQHGFVQQVIDTSAGRLVLLDTHEHGRQEGRLCKQRLEWLGEKIADCTDPIFLFLHHPPISGRFNRMDSIRLQEADALADVLERSNAPLRHLFLWPSASQYRGAVA